MREKKKKKRQKKLKNYITDHVKYQMCEDVTGSESRHDLITFQAALVKLFFSRFNYTDLNVVSCKIF